MCASQRERKRRQSTSMERGWQVYLCGRRVSGTQSVAYRAGHRTSPALEASCSNRPCWRVRGLSGVHYTRWKIICHSICPEPGSALCCRRHELKQEYFKTRIVTNNDVPGEFVGHCPCCAMLECRWNSRPCARWKNWSTGLRVSGRPEFEVLACPFARPRQSCPRKSTSRILRISRRR